MPGTGNGQVDKVLEELEKVGIVATNGKISEMGSGFIVNEGFDWTDIGRFIELYLPDGKDVYVCDLTGYKIAECGDGTLGGKVIVGTMMDTNEFFGLIDAIPKPTKGTHPIEANETERIAYITTAHCGLKGGPKKCIMLVDMKDVLVDVKFIIAGAGQASRRR